MPRFFVVVVLVMVVVVVNVLPRGAELHIFTGRGQGTGEVEKRVRKTGREGTRSKNMGRGKD